MNLINNIYSNFKPFQSFNFEKKWLNLNFLYEEQKIQVKCLFMKKIYTSLFILLAFSCGIFGQIAPVVPSSVSIANTSVAVQNEWSAFQNTAALAHIDKAEASMQFENRFMLKELSTRSIQGAIHTKYANVGLSYSYHGYSLYNEMIGGIGLARNFDDKFSMGVQFNYYTAYFSAAEESRYRGTVLAQFGISSRIFPKLIVGFHTFNPFQNNIKTENTEKRLPSIFSIGTNYEFADNLVWLTQIDKEVSSNFRFASGFEYAMIEQLTVKLGAYGQDYLVPAIGFGLHLKGFHFNLNTELHPQLGLNTLANLKYRF